MSNSNINLKDFEKYAKGVGRIVNQREIFEWLKEKGAMTENEIFEKIYNFRRGRFQSNKKYAECLRRLLATGKITRRKNEKHVFEYHIAVQNFNDEVFPVEIVTEEVNITPQLQNFDIVQTRNGNNYLVCVDNGILINIEKAGFLRLSELNDDLTHKDYGLGIDVWDIMEIYRGINGFSLQFMVDFKKNRKADFTRVWKRSEVKVYSYTMKQIKDELGISPSDTLVIEN